MPRLGRAALGGLVSAALAVTGVSVLASPASSATPTPQWRGAQLHVMWDSSSAEIPVQLNDLAQMHANSARLDVNWSSLEIAGRGQFDPGYAAKADSVIDGLNARGIKPVVTLTATPCWASSAPDSLKLGCSGDWWNRNVTQYAPSNPAYYAEAAAWVAQRWSGKLAALELWNEPNYAEYGLDNLRAADKAATYTAMVKAAYSAVKAVTSDVPVLAGSTAFADVAFIKSLWADGIRGSYDGISMHPYNEWREPGAPHDIAWAKYDLVQGLTQLHDAMQAIGDKSPVWITEFGYTSCTLGADRWCVTEDQQASYLAEAAKLVATWPWVRSFLVYNLRSKGTDPSSTEDNYGLLRADLTPKPAFGALGAAFASLGSAAPSDAAAAPVAPTSGTTPVDGSAGTLLPVPTAPTTSPTTSPTTAPTATPTAAPTAPTRAGIGFRKPVRSTKRQVTDWRAFRGWWRATGTRARHVLL